MPTTILSSREFNQDTARAKRAAADGPVIVTDRGKPSIVILSFEEYERLQKPKRSLAEALSMPGLDDIDLDVLIARPRDVPKPFEFD